MRRRGSPNKPLGAQPSAVVAPPRRQELVADVPPELGTMNVDADKVRDSLNHLLLNAIKFTPDEGSIIVSGHRGEDGGVVIKVSDSGCGIDPSHLPRLGEAFFTGFNVAHHSSGQFEHGRQGLGLGLSVVKAFVEMHGGKLDVESKVSCGSTFTISLPGSLADSPPAAGSLPKAG